MWHLKTHEARGITQGQERPVRAPVPSLWAQHEINIPFTIVNGIRSNKLVTKTVKNNIFFPQAPKQNISHCIFHIKNI